MRFGNFSSSGIEQEAFYIGQFGDSYPCPSPFLGLKRWFCFFLNFQLYLFRPLTISNRLFCSRDDLATTCTPTT